MNTRPFVTLAIAPLLLIASLAAAPSAAAADASPSNTKPRVKIALKGKTVGEPSQVVVRVTSGRIASAFVTVDSEAPVNLTPNGRRASAPLTWSQPGPVTITARVTLVNGRKPLVARVYKDIGMPETTSFTLVYALPADGTEVQGRVEGIQLAAETVDDWFAGQMDGLSPRFITGADGAPSVLTLLTHMTAAELASAAYSDFDEEVARWFGLGLLKPGTLPVIYLEGELWTPCGWSTGDSIVMPMPNCGIYPGTSPTSGFPYVGSSYLLAHEMTHALGAADDAAPHADGTGHVTDDRRDIIYAGPGGRDWDNLMLDPGNDDYHKTGRTDLFNIEFSPLLEGGTPRAATLVRGPHVVL